MELSDKHISFLNSVNTFSRAKRYMGMMPKHIVTSCNETDVDALHAGGYVAFVSMKAMEGGKMDGLVLTDKGMKIVTSDTAQA